MVVELWIFFPAFPPKTRTLSEPASSCHFLPPEHKDRFVGAETLPFPAILCHFVRYRVAGQSIRPRLAATTWRLPHLFPRYSGWSTLMTPQSGHLGGQRMVIPPLRARGLLNVPCGTLEKINWRMSRRGRALLRTTSAHGFAHPWMGKQGRVQFISASGLHLC